MSYQLLSIEKLDMDPTVPFPAYFVRSTAPINIEDPIVDGDEVRSVSALAELTAHLKRYEREAEVLILVHGYNTGADNVRYWYRNAAQEIARRYPQVPKGLVVIGYRWSSEQMNGDESGDVNAKRKSALDSLPKIMNQVYAVSRVGAIVGFVGSFLGYLLLTLKGIGWVFWLATFSGLFTVSVVLFAPLLTLFFLRVSNYFRDTYRANQYGVSDLVELIRQLDDSLVEQVTNPDRTARERYWENHRIRLSFIGHSMGAFVVTNAVRVLSDVFDRSSIGRLGRGPTGSGKLPTSTIGNVFSLGRLVLVAPDISSEAIISGRGNVLRSSLRRFEEAYLFCNEGDMALRLASTTANYFSFPARTRDGGYRLGNVTVREAMQPNKVERAGIVNLQPDGALVHETVRRFLSFLYIRRTQSLFDRQQEIGLEVGTRSISELFTYFDCTNYQEWLPNPKTQQLEPKGILTRALNKTSLEMKDYAFLCKDFVQGKCDPHGGYIFDDRADFTKWAIYGLAGLGWRGFLDILEGAPGFQEVLHGVVNDRPDLTSRQQHHVACLFILSHQCDQKGVQVLLSPERYQVDLMGQVFDRSEY
jgi:pimeloyl-ACP methyl ester carboxylesterase